MTKFNSREYEWADVSVVAAGRMITGIRGVSYTSSQEKEALYGKGNKPHSIQRGNKSYSGNIPCSSLSRENGERRSLWEP